jgi:hypothetical protein
MKANELRIGNYLMSNGIEIQIDCIQPNMLAKVGENFYTKFDLFEPLPLTKYWLIKAGAKKCGSTERYWISIPNLKAEIHFEIYEKEIVSTIKSQFAELILDRIKYVHEFQNLYFALTNNELSLSGS